MSGNSALSAYVEICRGFGLSTDEIKRLHAGGDVPEDVDPRKVVANALPDDPSAADAHAALLKVLSNASRGIDAPREYDAGRVATDLDAVLSAIGGTVSIVDANDEPVSAGGANPEPWRIDVEDPSGNIRSVSFSYPDHDLGTRNYPAIIDAMEESVLDGAPLTFVRLADEDRWRFVLVKESNLQALRENLGEQVTFAGGPLLAADQPSAFVADTASDAAESASLVEWGDVFLELGTTIAFEPVMRGKPVLSLSYTHSNYATIAHYFSDSDIRCKDDLYYAFHDLIDKGCSDFYDEEEHHRFVREMITSGHDSVLNAYADFLEACLDKNSS
jgi:hypothetical protein